MIIKGMPVMLTPTWKAILNTSKGSNLIERKEHHYV